MASTRPNEPAKTEIGLNGEDGGGNDALESSSGQKTQSLCRQAWESDADGAGSAQRTEPSPMAAASKAARVSPGASRAPEAALTRTLHTANETGGWSPTRWWNRAVRPGSISPHVGSLSPLHSARAANVRSPPTCGAPSTLLRTLYALTGTALAISWALLARLTDEALSVHGIASQLSQMAMAPLLVGLLAVGLARSLLGWKSYTVDHGSQTHRHSVLGVTAAFASLIVLFVAVNLMDPVADVLEPPPPLPVPTIPEPCREVSMADISPGCREQGVIIGQIDPYLNYTDLGEVGTYMGEVGLAVRQLERLRTSDVTDAEALRCTEYLVAAICDHTIRRCTDDCRIAPPCSLCVGAQESCPWIYNLLPVLQIPELQHSVLFGLTSISPAPAPYLVDLIYSLLQCSSDSTVVNPAFRSAPVGSTQCSGPEFTPGTDSSLKCNVNGHEARVLEYRRSLLAVGDRAERNSSLIRRSIYRALFVVLAWLVSAVDVWRAKRAHHRRSQAPTSEADGPAMLEEARPAFRIANFLHDSRSFASAELPPPTFGHVIGWRGSALGLLMVLCLGAGVRAAFLAGTAGNAAFSLFLAGVVLLTSVTTLPGILAWDGVYLDAVRGWRFGHRSHAFRSPDGDRTILHRLSYLSRRWAYKYDMTFGIAGSLYDFRLAAAEAVEVLTQLFSVFGGTETTPNDVVLVTLGVVMINVVGSWLMWAIPNHHLAKQARTAFDVLIDLFFVVWNSTTVDYANVIFVQALALTVPLLLVGIALRELADFLIFEQAQRDCQRSRLPHASKQSQSKSTLRLHGFGTMFASADCGHDTPLSTPQRCNQKGCKKKTLFAMLSAALSISACVALFVVINQRVVTMDVKCEREAGPLFWGVSLSDRRYFRDGLLAEPACGFEHVQRLELRRSSIAEIDDRIALFTNVEAVDARDCAELVHVSAAVAKLPHLSVLLLHGSPAARQLSWSHAGLARLHPVLFQQTELVSLDLSGNNFTSLSHRVSELRNLRVLNVSYNSLGDDVFEALASVSELTELYVNNNAIESIPETVSVRSAIRRYSALDLRSNELREIPSEVLHPPKAHVLLGGNPVGGFGVRETSIGPDFPEALFDLPLVSIDVSVGVIERIPASISKLAPSLRFLSLWQTLITHDNIPREVAELGKLVLLRLTGNPIANDQGLPPDVLFDIPSLEHLSVGCTRTSQVPARVWEMPKLHILEVHFNRDIVELPPIPDSVKNVSLRVLNLMDTGFEEVPDLLLQAPLIDALTMWKIGGPGLSTEELWDAAALAEQTSSGRLRCELQRLYEPDDTLLCVDDSGSYADVTLDMATLCPFHLGDGGLDGILGGG